LKKGEIGGFALIRLAEIPPAPFTKGGNLFYGQALRIIKENELQFMNLKIRNSQSAIRNYSFPRGRRIMLY
jgi:hypothetical protein